MGGVGCLSGDRTLDLPPLVYRSRAVRNTPKSPAWCGGSKRLGPAFGVIPKSLFAEAIKLSGLRVGLDLSVPDLGVELGKPSAELRQLNLRQVADLLLELLNFSHGVASGSDEKLYRAAASSPANALCSGGPRCISAPARARHLLRARCGHDGTPTAATCS